MILEPGRPNLSKANERNAGGKYGSW